MPSPTCCSTAIPKANIAKIDADIMSYPGLAPRSRRPTWWCSPPTTSRRATRSTSFASSNGVPFVVGRVFTRGIGGEVFAYRPPDGACLACLEAALQRTPFREGIREIDLVSEEEREKVYGMEIAEIKDSPGLTVDITFITSFHTRFVLDAIARRLPERPKFLDPISENYLVWGNRPVHPFNKHFQLQRTELSPQEQCAVCATRSVAHAV